MDSKAWIEISSKLQSISSNWTSFTLLGSFILYLVGYLSLRFHMTILGLGTDISVFDERYFFTGINFFIYLVSSIPTLILIGVVLYFPIKIIIRLLQKIFVKKISFNTQFILIVGITISVIVIQFLMRQCLPLTNLLVFQDTLPIKPSWLVKILINKDFQTLYFLLLLTTIIIPMVIWWNIQSVTSNNREFNWLKRLFSFLLIVQFLFLPINYGMLIMEKTMPRVVIPTLLKDKKNTNVEFWLIWEGKIGITYLKRDLLKNNKRTLLTVNKKEILSQEIVCYDDIFKVILNGKQSCFPN